MALRDRCRGAVRRRLARQYERVADRIRVALGDRALVVEHIGSTSVPGLAAKPVIDINLIVADSGDEAAYLPDLESAGFTLRVREPEWEQHRVLATEAPATNLHVFSPGSGGAGPNPDVPRLAPGAPGGSRRLRCTQDSLAERHFTEVMDYNNHKAGFVYDVYERIFAADPAHAHDPQPRAVSYHGLDRAMAVDRSLLPDRPPFDLLDRESARVDALVRDQVSLGDAGPALEAPTRCAG